MAEIVLIDHEATSDLKWIADMLQDDSSFKQPHLDDSAPQSSPPIPFCPSQTLNISGPLYRGTGANAICPPPLPITQNSGFSSLLVAPGQKH